MTLHALREQVVTAAVLAAGVCAVFVIAAGATLALWLLGDE